jgi:hypothetical protein
MKKQFLFFLLLALCSIITFSQIKSLSTEIVENTLRKSFNVVSSPSFVNDFKSYFSSSAFSQDLQTGKWGQSISMIVDSKTIEVNQHSSASEIQSFQSKISTATLIDPTLLLAIGALGAQIKEIIEKAQAAGQILEVEAANQIATVIEQTRQAYRTELNLTLDRISAAASNALNSLKTVISELEQQTYRDIRDLERRAMEISHNLPLSKHFPQIIKWNPSYTYKNSQLYLKQSENWSEFLKVKTTTSGSVVIASGALSNDDKSIHFEIEGDFYDLPSKNYNATVTIKGRTFTNGTKSSQDASFDIPIDALDFSEMDIKYNYLNIVIPYKKNVFLFFKKKQIAEFSLPIITLPKNVGSLTITTTVKEPSLLVQNFKAGPYAQISDDDDIKCGGEHADLAIHCVPPEPGWRVRPATVSYQMIRSEGDWYPCGPDHSGLANACYSFSTIHHGFGTSGKIWFYLTYTGEKDAIVERVENHDISINWEDSKVFILPDGATWKGAFKQFDGKIIEFSGPFENNYIKVSQDMRTITIKIKP